MLLKRAADLVEALYGTPHNNQVRHSHLPFSWVWLFLLDKNTHLNLSSCRTSFWSEPRTLRKLSTASPGIPARSRLSPAPQLTVAWWASILMAASLESAFQSQHREIIKVLPFSESKFKHLIYVKGWLCWSQSSESSIHRPSKECVSDTQCNHWIIPTLCVLLDVELFRYHVASFNWKYLRIRLTIMNSEGFRLTETKFIGIIWIKCTLLLLRSQVE